MTASKNRVPAPGVRSGKAPRRSDIQWLRAIAAITIVLWHSDLIVKHLWPDLGPPYPAYQTAGGFGVELFFMLSGYSIAMQVERLPRPGEFLLTRAYRIYPLYWLFTGAMVLAWMVNPAWPLSARAGNGVDFVLMSFLALPQARVPLLPLGWTLELELIFYLLVASTMASGLLRSARSSLGWFLAALGVTGFAIGSPPSGGMVIFEVLSPFMAAFAFGWLMRCDEARTGTPIALPAAAVALFVALALVLPERESDCAIRMALSAILLAGVTRLEPFFERHPRIALPGRVVGNASFSIYLSHWFVLSAIGKAATQLPVAWMGVTGLRFAGAALSIAVGIGVYEFVESPISRAIGAWRSGRKLRGGRPHLAPEAALVPAKSDPPP